MTVEESMVKGGNDPIIGNSLEEIAREKKRLADLAKSIQD